jgi:WD40 repeat protein
MHHAHERGVVHRDLKPANILLQKPQSLGSKSQSGSSPASDLAFDNWDLSPKVTDFGLAKLLDSDVTGPTRTGDVVGTPSYMAPELAAGKAELVGPATDVYGLGTILYEMLTGWPPFPGWSVPAVMEQVRSVDPVPPRRLVASVPRDLETVALKCLAKEPHKRYPSALALAEDLRRFQEERPILARPTSTAERVWKWVRRRPAVAALLATVVVVAALGFLGVVWQLRKTGAALAESQRANDAARAQLYFNRIALAQHELFANHVSSARRLLNASPTDARDWEWRYLKRLSETSLFTLPGNGSHVQTVAYSADGQLLASGSGDWYTGRDGELVVWDARAGQRLLTLSRDIGTVFGVAFHPTQPWLASASFDAKIRIWDARTGQKLHELGGHTGWACAVAFSPDGRLLASCDANGRVRVWDCNTGKLIREWRYHRTPVWTVAFSPDSRFLVSGDRDGFVHLWDPNHISPEQTFWAAGDVRAAAISPDGSWLALGHYNGPIAVFDLKRPTEKPSIRRLNAGPILGLVFTPDGNLAWCSREGFVKIQDLRTFEDLHVFRGHDGWGYSVAVSPDGRRLACGGSDGAVRIYDGTLVDERPRYLTDSADLPGLTYDTDGRLLVLGGVRRRNTLEVWNAATGESVFSLPDQPNVSAATGSPDGRFWAWVADGKMLRVRDRARPVDVWSRELTAGPVTGLAYSPDGRWLAWGGADGVVRLCDAASGNEVRTVGSHGSAVTGVAFQRDGQILATAGQDGTFGLWALATGTPVAVFGESGRDEDRSNDADPPGDRQVAANVTRLAFSPDGRRLAAANPRRPLEIWDVATGRVALVLDWDGEGVSSAAWSADGQRLAATFGKRVKSWDATEQSVEARRRATEGSAQSWHKSEAAWARARGDWYAADYHLSRLIADDSIGEREKASHYGYRGTAHAWLAESGRSDLKTAAEDVAQAAGRVPTSLDLVYSQAVLALATGDQARYRAICADVLARFGETAKGNDANTVAWICTMAPDATVDPTRPVAIARRAVEGDRNSVIFLNTLGVALYRAGQFVEARDCLTKSAGTHKAEGEAWDWLYLGLAYGHTGPPERARFLLDRALRAIDGLTAEHPPPGATFTLTWEQRLELRLLRREAAEWLQRK